MTSPAVHYCSNPAKWHPAMHTHQDHHHPPKAWRALLEAEPSVDRSWWALLPACGYDHDELHTLLNAYVHAGGVPKLTGYSLWARKLAAEAWKHRPSDKPPYTLTSPGDVHV